MSKVYNIRDISSIRDMVETSCELFADNPAFLSRDGETVNTVTYAEAGEDIRALATELTARGCRGKKVAVMGANCYQWALTYLAVCSGVGIIVPVDREYTGEQISYVMRDSGAAMLIHGDGVSTAVESAGLSFFREVLLAVPLVMLLPRVFGLMGVLYSMPVADILTFFASCFVLLRTDWQLRK